MFGYVRIALTSLLAVLFVLPSCLAQVAWAESYEDALKQAAVEKKFLVVDISASWCGFCRKMAREVYPDPEFVSFSRHQVFVRLFADTSPEGKTLAGKFMVRGFPTIVVLNAKGEEVGRIVGCAGCPTADPGLGPASSTIQRSQPPSPAIAR